jgi:hypothetical protein
MSADPEVEGVKSTLQLAVPTKVPGVSVQVPEELKLPVADPKDVKATLPLGVTAVPALEVSWTKAVQVEVLPTVTGVVQATIVELVRR